jgi:hypothetical protein
VHSARGKDEANGIAERIHTRANLVNKITRFKWLTEHGDKTTLPGWRYPKGGEHLYASAGIGARMMANINGGNSVSNHHHQSSIENNIGAPRKIGASLHRANQIQGSHALSAGGWHGTAWLLRFEPTL